MSDTKRIHIVHTNDIHSRFENMPKISSYIKQKRATANDNQEIFIAVDLGDHMDRMRIETEGSYGKANITILNETGIDIATIGNNEGLTFTKQQLEDAFKYKNYKIVVNNLIDANTGKIPEWLEEYWIEEYEGIKVAWLGATAPYETFYSLQGWDIVEPFQRLEETIDKIKNKVDIIILLSHLGIKSDERIAEKLPNIDAILGAHTHRFFPEGIKAINQPIICQVGIFGEYIGHLTIDFNIKTRKIDSIEEKTIKMDEIENDPRILDVIKNFRMKADKELSKPVAFLAKELTISIDSESDLGNLLADGVKKWVNSEIALVNSGQITENLTRGEITKGIIHKVCPSPINPCRLTLTGKEIRRLLEQSLLDEMIYLQLKGYGFRGHQLGTLCVSGLTISYNSKGQPYEKINNIFVDDQPLVNEKEYTVGTLDMFTFGGGYSMKEAKDIHYYLPEFIRDILLDQLTNRTAIDQCSERRWVDFWQK